MSEVIVLQVSAEQCFYRRQRDCRPIAHRKSHHAIELDDGRGILREQCVIERDDLRPVRRCGVRRLRMQVFALGSTFAAAGGILAASRLQAVNQSSGGSDLLLLSIAGPVIAGTSLFGGRGSVWGALLGALVAFGGGREHS